MFVSFLACFENINNDIRRKLYRSSVWQHKIYMKEKIDKRIANFNKLPDKQEIMLSCVCDFINDLTKKFSRQNVFYFRLQK